MPLVYHIGTFLIIAELLKSIFKRFDKLFTLAQRSNTLDSEHMF